MLPRGSEKSRTSQNPHVFFKGDDVEKIPEFLYGAIMGKIRANDGHYN